MGSQRLLWRGAKEKQANSPGWQGQTAGTPQGGNSTRQESPRELHADNSQRRKHSLNVIQGIPSYCRVPAALPALSVA